MQGVWAMVKETGGITATILILVFAATLYTRMLGLSGLPTELGSNSERLAMAFFKLRQR
jgi:TRAP-type C4-dicarboxylate transport system permease large subunit